MITPPVTDAMWKAVQPQRIPANLAREQQISTSVVTVIFDSARYLPDNVSATQVFAKVFNPKSNTAISDVKANSRIILDTPVYFPAFKMVATIPRASIQQDSTLVATLVTCDRFSCVTVEVGVSAFPLCVAESAEGGGIQVNTGAFQVPIYVTVPTKEQMQSPEALNSLPRVPCATLLLRIIEQSFQESMLDDIDYTHGIYQSLPHCEPMVYEKLLYPFVDSERKRFTVRDKVLGMKDLPRTAMHTEANLLSWITEKLQIFPNPNVPKINLSSICKYDANYGIKFSVDSAINVGSKGFTIAVTSFAKSRFRFGYDIPECFMPNDYIYTKQLNYESKMNHPEWQDGYVWYRKRPLDPSMVIVVELFVVVGAEVKPAGWTAIAPFSPYGFVRQGRFKLALLDRVPWAKALRYWRRDNPEMALEAALADEAVDLSPTLGAIFVRLADARRADEVGLDTLPSLDFVGSVASRFKSPKWSISRVNSLVPKRQDKQDFDRRVYETFIDQTHLPYVP